ncbi:MAG: hypothetical protein A2W22_01755 [Candidatus Levybacteria bacterium RBG_16_35_11]|nr:MAG: hypothetical protein A2W22_01755 [Candidatus Levybacteria bacterium RBG_16_35_11]
MKTDIQIKEDNLKRIGDEIKEKSAELITSIHHQDEEKERRDEANSKILRKAEMQEREAGRKG